MSDILFYVVVFGLVGGFFGAFVHWAFKKER
jgi:hypothetical protein